MNTVGMFRTEPGARSYQAGETVFAVGAPGDVMFVVLEGEVDIALNGTVLETVGPGGIVGELALIDAGLRSADVVTRGPARLVPVSKDRFIYLIQQTPYFALHVMRILADRLRRMNLRA